MANKWFKPGKATVLVDGQYGSTGKGVFAAYVAMQDPSFDIATTNAGPNSGHTAIINGVPMVAYHLPMSAAIHREVDVYLNAGAIIDLELLYKEMYDLNIPNVTVHPAAALISKHHKELEQLNTSYVAKIASTQKGVGSALANKITRNPNAVIASEQPTNIGIAERNLNRELLNGKKVFVEVSQGFSLSLNASPFYPHTTSRDCTLNQALSDANIHPSFLYKTIMTLRTYPIRVGNIIENDTVIGKSGDCYYDQKETSWEEIGIKPEYTTVTKRKRRVFTWSNQQVHAAMSANRPTDVFLNFVNYLRTPDQLTKMVDVIFEIASTLNMPTPTMYYGFGPNHTTDIEFLLTNAIDRLKETLKNG